MAIYQWGWLGGLLWVFTPGTILSGLPTILVGILFGLAMDDMLFLGSVMLVSDRLAGKCLHRSQGGPIPTIDERMATSR